MHNSDYQCKKMPLIYLNTSYIKEIIKREFIHKIS